MRLSLFGHRPDPVTGDSLSPSDQFSWLVQGVIRRWTFIGVITLVTAIWWTHPVLFHDPGLVHWNLVASWMALAIESAVGIGLFNQTRRDAVILRSVARSEKRIEAQEALILAAEERLIHRLAQLLPKEPHDASHQAP